MKSKVKNFLFSLFIYLLITFLTAVSVVLLSSKKPNTNINISNNQTVTIPPQLTNIVNNISQQTSTSIFDITANINTETDNIKININGKFNINNQNENKDVTLSANVNIIKNNKQTDLKIAYLNNFVYLTFLDKHYKISFNNLLQILSNITSMLNINLPSMDLNNFNINDILSLFSDLTETKTDNEIILTIKLPMIGSMQILCDLNYKIKEIHVPKTSLDGLSFNLDAQFTNIEQQPIQIPTNDYKNIDTTIDLINLLMKKISENNLGFNFEILLNRNKINGIINIDIQNFNLYLEMNILNNPLKLTLIEDIVYFSYLNLNFKFNLFELTEIENIINKQLNLNIPLFQIIGKLKNINVPTPHIQYKNNNENNKLLNTVFNIIENCEYVDETYILNIDEKMNITINTNNFDISSIKMQVPNLELALTSKPYNEINHPIYKYRYTNVNAIIPHINNVLKILNNYNINGNGTIQIKNELINYNFTIRTQKTLYCNLEFNLKNNKINIIILNKDIYITLNDFKFKTNVIELSNFLTQLQTEFNINIFDLLFENKANKIANNLITYTNLKIDSVTENSFKLLLFNNFSINLINDNNTSKIKLNNNSTTITLNLTGNNDELSINPTIDETLYHNFSNLLTPIKEILNNHKLSLQGSIKLSNSNNIFELYKLNINFENKENIKLDIKAKLNNLDINIFKENNDAVYIKLGKINTILKFNDIKQLKNSLEKIQPNKIGLSTIINLIPNLTQLQKSDTGINIATDKFKMNINYNNNFQNINFTTNNLIGNFKFNDCNNMTFEKPNINSYYSFKTIQKYIDALINLITSKQYNFEINALLLNNNTAYNNINAIVQADLQNDLKLYAKINTLKSEGPLVINSFNNNFYVDYNNLALQFNINTIKELLINIKYILNINPELSQNLISKLNLPILEINNTIKTLSTLSMAVAFKLDNIELINNSFIMYFDNSTNIVFKFQNKTFSSIAINNLQIGVNSNNRTNIIINIKPFKEIIQNNIQANRYTDINQITDLVKMTTNTLNSKNLNINGSININGKIFGINLNTSIPYNIKIKINEQKQPEIMLTIKDIPAIVGINNDIPYQFGDTDSGSNRTLKVYYKDNYLYFYRTDNVKIVFGAGFRIYEKKLKISIKTFAENPSYYFQYAFGLNNDIMKLLKSSVDSLKNYKCNITKLITNFSINKNYDCSFYLNLAELLNNPSLQTLALHLSARTIDGLLYLHKIQFNTFVQVDNNIAFNISSNDGIITNSEIDLAELNNYIDNYSFNENYEWHS